MTRPGRWSARTLASHGPTAAHEFRKPEHVRVTVKFVIRVRPPNVPGSTHSRPGCGAGPSVTVQLLVRTPPRRLGLGVGFGRSVLAVRHGAGDAGPGHNGPLTPSYELALSVSEVTVPAPSSSPGPPIRGTDNSHGRRRLGHESPACESVAAVQIRS